MLNPFRTRYRIVGDSWKGYEVQLKFGWFGFWHMPKCNTWSSVEEAREYIKRISFVEYVEDSNA